MEVEESQTYQGRKLLRIGNGDKKGDEQYLDDEEDGDVKGRSNGGGGGGEVVVGGGGGGGFDFSRLCGWPSSRIVRVSRASGGKDRHSKVLTSKGLRDRRVRLSVNTAIQFYDLQDRLGCDQPSKAVEWLMKAAASSIAELPSIDTLYPDTINPQDQQHRHQLQQLSDEKRSTGGAQPGFDSADVEIDGSFDPNYQIQHQQQQQQQQNGALMSVSVCSSNSDNSKDARADVEPLRAGRLDPGLSLSRSKNSVKARERARGRAAGKEKDKETETAPRVVHHQQLHHHQQHDQHSQNLNPISQNASSFTELLTSGMNTTSNAGGNNINHSNTGTHGSVHQNHSSGGGGNANEANLFHKSPRHWSPTPMDYFATPGLLGPSTRSTTHGFSGQLHFGEHYQEMPPFSVVPDHFVPLVTVAGGNNGSNNNNNNAYDLNFTISSSSSCGLAGFNRGTLQSNSSTPSLLPHLQRFPSTDGSPSAFFISTAPPAENHHHFLTGFDARLQLCYGDGRHSDYKGKGKN